MAWSKTGNIKGPAGGSGLQHVQHYTGVTTNASGMATVPHAAPFTPSAVMVSGNSPGGSWAVFMAADSFTAADCRMRWMHASTAGSYASAATGPFTALYLE